MTAADWAALLVGIAGVIVGMAALLDSRSRRYLFLACGALLFVAVVLAVAASFHRSRPEAPGGTAAGKTTGAKTAGSTPPGGSATAQPVKTQPPRTPTPSPSKPVAVVSKTYSTSEPFPLCDPGRAQWILVNLMPGSCGQNMGPMVPDGGYSYVAAKSFPNGARLDSSNTVTVTGTIAHYVGVTEYGCLGPAEGSATGGYMALLCNDGHWYIDRVVGLGSQGPVAGGQLASGTYSYSYGASYAISLTFRGGAGNLSITLQGAGGIQTQGFSTGPFTPAAVGYALDTNIGDGSQYDVIATLSGFVYTAN